MSGYVLAWSIISIATLVGAGVVWVIFSRHQIEGVLRTSVIAALVAFFLIPAPIPNYESELAPAFIVLIFEVFFQIDGQPQGSIRNLLIGLIVALGVSFLAHYLLRRFVPAGNSLQTGLSDPDPG